jgi:uncharacterized cupredoxin-like copper-binding protein
MRTSRSVWLAVALGLALVGAAVAGMVAHAGGSGTRTITVTEREYSLTLSGKAAAGTIRFVVRNKGHLAHALQIAGPGVAKRLHLVQPGATATLVVKLQKGKYSLWCPVPGHATLGMKASVSTGGAAAPMSTTATTTSGAAWG